MFLNSSTGRPRTACIPATKPRSGRKQYAIEIILVHGSKRANAGQQNKHKNGRLVKRLDR